LRSYVGAIRCVKLKLKFRFFRCWKLGVCISGISNLQELRFWDFFLIFENNFSEKWQRFFGQNIDFSLFY
jgi:hypothetical protein